MYLITDWEDVFVKARRLGTRIRRGEKKGALLWMEELVISVQLQGKCYVILFVVQLLSNNQRL